MQVSELCFGKWGYELLHGDKRKQQPRHDGNRQSTQWHQTSCNSQTILEQEEKTLASADNSGCTCPFSDSERESADYISWYY